PRPDGERARYHHPDRAHARRRPARDGGHGGGRSGRRHDPAGLAVHLSLFRRGPRWDSERPVRSQRQPAALPAPPRLLWSRRRVHGHARPASRGGAMTLAVVVLLLVTSGAALGIALLLSRRARRTVETRVALVTPKLETGAGPTADGAQKGL